MLLRLKLRQGWSFPTLESAFNISSRSARRYFWETILHFCTTNFCLREMNQWNSPMDPANLDKMYQSIVDNMSPLHAQLARRMQDPRHESRQCVFLAIDSTKVKVMKSTDFNFQQSTYHSPLGSHHVRFILPTYYFFFLHRHHSTT